jgi:hypothetical protein
MSPPDTVDDGEILARFIYSRRQVTREDGSEPRAKVGAFVAHPYQELSVQRHLGSDEAELWHVGSRIGACRRPHVALVARADVITGKVRQALASIESARSMAVRSDPTPENPGHAIIADWPLERAMQDMIALELAAISTCRLFPG